jgi:hypothetical protein
MKKLKPVSVIPKAILVGVEGSLPLLSSHFQNQTSGKVSVTTQKGLIAFEMVPDTFQSVLRSAQYVRVEPFWWKTIQKTITIKKITISAAIRFHSGTASMAVRGCGALGANIPPGVVGTARAFSASS